MSRKSKISASHVTRIDQVETLYRALQTNPEIVKFSMGPISRVNGGIGRIRVKISEDSGAIKLLVRGPGATQVMRIYSRDRAVAVRALTNLIHDLDWEIFGEKGEKEDKPQRLPKRHSPRSPGYMVMSKGRKRGGPELREFATSSESRHSPFDILKTRLDI